MLTRGRFLAGARDEAGAVAIVVAVSLSTFLLGFAALAVDLGSAYARRAEMQNLADRLAVSAAAHLPDSAAALAALSETLERVCAADSSEGVDGVCPGGWENDADPANGGVTYFTDTDRDGRLGPADLETSLGNPAIGLRVQLPASRVDFGLGSVLGQDGVDVTRSATARIGTAMGRGMLPIALTEQALITRQWCVIDPAVPSPTTSYVSPPGPRPWLWPPSVTISPASLPYDAPAGSTVQVSLSGFSTLTDVRIFFANAGGTGEVPATPVPGNSRAWTVPVPGGAAGQVVNVWATGRRLTFFGWENFVTYAKQFTYTGTPDPLADPCAQPQADSGFLTMARTDTGSGDALETNVRRGPQVPLYSALEQPDLLTAHPTDPCATQAVRSAACVVPVLGEPFSERFHDGLFSEEDGVPGRVVGDCGGGTSTSGGHPGVDATSLFGVGNHVVDTSFGSTSALRTDVLTGTADPGDRGWITSRALRCGRFGIAPVVGDTPLPDGATGRPVERFVYVWIDGTSSERGLRWSGSDLYAVRGYVIDPGYLPETVTGSPVIGPWLGPDLPTEPLLVRDPGAAP